MLITGTNKTDFLRGAEGSDTLTGGKGQDVFILAIGGGDDFVTDFKPTPGDYNHSEKLVFGGFGAFETGNHLDDGKIQGGDVFHTIEGHALTLTDTGNDLLLQWDTGDSFTLFGVDWLNGSAVHSF